MIYLRKDILKIGQLETTKEKACQSILEQIVSLREFFNKNFPPQWHDNFK